VVLREQFDLRVTHPVNNSVNFGPYKGATTFQAARGVVRKRSWPSVSVASVDSVFSFTVILAGFESRYVYQSLSCSLVSSHSCRYSQTSLPSHPCNTLLWGLLFDHLQTFPQSIGYLYHLPLHARRKMLCWCKYRLFDWLYVLVGMVIVYVAADLFQD
jgi:hypothetical protein